MKELYQAHDRFMFRVPTAEDTKILYNNEEVINACKDKAFREKIEIASPSLANMMDLFLDTPDKLGKKKKNDFIASIMKYYIRSRERTTPFGLFSGVGVGKFDKEESLDNRQMHFQKRVNIDTEWLFEYIVWLEKKYYNRLKFKINNACYANGNRVILMYSTQKDIDEISVRYTKVFEIVKSTCQTYKSFEEVYQEIQTNYPDVEKKVIENYIQELIQKQILISSLRPSFTSRNQLNYFKQQCKKAGLFEVSEVLEELQVLCREYENTAIGEGILNYRKIIEFMKKIHKGRHYLQVDTVIQGSDIRLSDSLKKSVEHLATFFVTMSSLSRKSNEYMEHYRNIFLEKYGFGREVPILEMLDTAIGIGAPKGYLFPQNDFFEESIQETDIPSVVRNYFMSKYEEALKNKTAIQLDMESIQYALDLPEANNAPLSFEIYFLLKDFNGQIKLHLGTNGGSVCAGKTFGRFSAESEELGETLLQLNEKERQMRSGNIENCEISYLPAELRSGNVVRCITGREKNLTAYTNTEQEAHEIRLEDIRIGATETHFYAKNANNGKYIVFGSNNMYNIMLQPNAFRFLLEIANDGKVTWFDHPWKHAYLTCRHIPQIEFEGIVLSNEQWFINRINLGLSAKDNNYQKFKEALLTYIKQEEIPKKIYLTEDDNRISLDLNSDLAIHILFDEYKKKGENSIILERVEEGSSLMYENGEVRSTEIVVPFFRKQKDIFHKQNAETMMISRKQHIVFPYDNWLYMKVYCKKDREEELIALQLNDFGCYLKKNFGIEHFFIRYLDPKPHIRLRFYANSQTLLQVTPIILNWAREMEEKRIIGDLNISVYEKEIERYGGIELMELAEELFRMDSVIVEEILYRKRLKQLDMEDIEVAVASVLQYVYRFFDGFQEQLAYLTLYHHTNVYINEFKEKKKNLLELFDLENGWNCFKEREDRNELITLLEQRNPLIDNYNRRIMEKNENKEFKSNIVNSVLHLHCNRLLGTNRELERKVMAFAESIMYAKKFKLMKEE
ncbi:MAG: lantibiotic dehydratase [Agathobacter sp.]|nr:lantibiotic dehydratase [Agathobacter sp.]